MARDKSYVLDQIAEDDFSLIAIHTSCEAYHLAFLLNSNCHCRFVRSKKRKVQSQVDFPFIAYQWIDPMKGIEIRFFYNRFLVFQNETEKGTSLFDLPRTKELYLIQDLKDVDYIVKIDSGIDANVLIQKMESIDQISYQYLIEQSRFDIDLSLNLF